VFTARAAKAVVVADNILKLEIAAVSAGILTDTIGNRGFRSKKFVLTAAQEATERGSINYLNIK